MRRFIPTILWASAALILWLIDAALLSFYQEGSFLSALLTGVPIVRLILRTIFCGLLFFMAYRSLLGNLQNAGPYNIWLGEGDEALFCGSAESSRREERILFHCWRLAQVFKMSAADKLNLRTLIYCHDIGHVAVPRAILKKEGVFNEHEQELWDTHLHKGAEILNEIPCLASAAELVRCHEEYFNGGGPLGLAGQSIPMACRIFRVVWMYDYMVYPASFRTKPMVCDEALLELRYYAGSALDPEVVEAFIKLMTKNSILVAAGGRAFSIR